MIPIGSIMGNERTTETIIDQQLKNLGWEDNPYSPKRTVWKQEVKTEKQRRSLGGRRPDYVLYPEGGDKPLAVIEAKAQGKNIPAALEQGIAYAKKIGAPIVFATDGVFTKTFHIACGESLFLNEEEVHELLEYKTTIQYSSENKLSTLNQKVQKSRGELIAVFSKANDLLREEGLQAGIERFSEFSTLLFLKIFSEMEQIRVERGDKSRTQKDVLWDSFKDENGYKLLSYVNDTVIQWFATEYERDIFQKLSIRNPANLKAIIDLLSGLQLTDTDVDIKGDAFEYFIKAYSAANPSDLGEIFTPRHIVKTMVKLLNPKVGETVYDPFCGTGGMLIVAFKHIMESMASTEHNLKILKKETLFGTELTKTARIAKMNMILAGDGHSNILQKDSFQNPLDQKYDIIITNYPFAQKTRYGGLYHIPSRSGDVIAPQHCFRALKDGGRMAFIAPEGFLFRQERTLRDVRKFLIENANLKSIISLPQGCFLPYNGVKASILYFDEVRRPQPHEHFFFHDVKNDGFSLDKRRSKIEGANDLDKVLSERNLDSIEDDQLKNLGISKIKLKDVQNSNYNLSRNTYEKHINIKIQRKTVSFGDLFELSGREKIGKDEQAPVMSITMKMGLVDQKDRFKRRIASKDISNYRKVYRNELVVGFPIDEGVLGIQTKYDFAAVSPAYKVWKLKRKDIIVKYLDLILRSKNMRKVYASKMQGCVERRRSIPNEILKQIKIPFPDIKIQKDIVLELEQYQKTIDDCRKKIQNKIEKIWD